MANVLVVAGLVVLGMLFLLATALALFPREIALYVLVMLTLSGRLDAAARWAEKFKQRREGE